MAIILEPPSNSTGRRKVTLRDGQAATYCDWGVMKHVFNVFITYISFNCAHTYTKYLSLTLQSCSVTSLFPFSSSTNHEYAQKVRNLTNIVSTEGTSTLGSINICWSSSVLLQYFSWTSGKLFNLLSVKSFQCHCANLGMKAQLSNSPLLSHSLFNCSMLQKFAGDGLVILAIIEYNWVFLPM